jgi:hypothetical protein
LYLRLDRRQRYKRDARASTSQREQYEGTVHLFIGTGHSLCEITFMPFMFTIDLRTNYWGLDSLSSLSRFLFLVMSRNSLVRSFGAGSAFVECAASALVQPSFRPCFPYCAQLHPVSEGACMCITLEKHC